MPGFRLCQISELPGGQAGHVMSRQQRQRTQDSAAEQLGLYDDDDKVGKAADGRQPGDDERPSMDAIDPLSDESLAALRNLARYKPPVDPCGYLVPRECAYTSSH